ncbi:MAG: Uma2 family endonuclease [Oscillatoria sp. PMC 1068.18]|nr:Uma2 family endonuclease [Oscillatoria sp. PMC 1076.18]MEC4991870.1 Uma2 family endonuclease [Oscillatoria sp. PMC 1068.18]
MVLDIQQHREDIPPTPPPTDIWSDEPELESYRHLKQLILLLTCLERLWSDRQDFFAAVNMSVYYSTEQLKSRDFRGPDFFVVLDTERKERKSWVVWGENGKYPNLIIEILSDSTAGNDRGSKKQLYQNIWRSPEYFWFHPYTLEFCGFKRNPTVYEEIAPNNQGWLWSDELQLYLGIFDEQLRFFTSAGELVLTPDEAEAQALQRATEAETRITQVEARVTEVEAKVTETEAKVTEAEAKVTAAEAKAEAERQRAENLLQRLRDLGIEPEDE